MLTIARTLSLFPATICCYLNLLSQSSFVLEGVTPLHFENAKVVFIRHDIIVRRTTRGQNEASLSANNIIQDTTRVQQGTFRFSGDLSREYEEVGLNIFKGDTLIWRYFFYLQPGKSSVLIDSAITESQKTPEAIFTNVPFLKEQEDYQKTVDLLADSTRETFNLWRYAQKVRTSGHDTSFLAERYKRLKTELKRQTISFVSKNASSYYALVVFQREVMPGPFLGIDSLVSLFSLFPSKLRDTQLGVTIASDLERLRSLSIGRNMPDFEFLTDDNQPLRLSTLTNSGLTLVGFWNVGCKPCITHIPYMKEIAEKYSDKGLQLLWVCTDSNEMQWRKRLQQLSMPWLHTSDSKTYRGDVSLGSLYNITYYPQYFLIDSNGKLIYHNVQSKDDEQHSVLNAILNKSLN